MPDDPLFLFSITRRQTLTTFLFVKFLRETLNLAGNNASQFTGHSFRCGGATFAFKIGIPGELIKYHGDWSSDAYFTMESKCLTAKKMGEWIRDHDL